MQRRIDALVWLIGISLGAIIVVLITPQTSWIAREEWVSVLTMEQTPAVRITQTPAAFRTGSVYAAYKEVAGSHPNDMQIQLALADMRSYPSGRNWTFTLHPKVQAISNLASRFGNSPAYYADKLRFESEVATFGEDDRGLSGNATAPVVPPPTIDRQALDAYIADAQTGERLDPNNAYFPFMEAAGLFADKRDAEAIAAIERAGSMSRWDDYVLDDVYGNWRLQELAFGDKSAVSRFVLDGLIMFPDLATMRAVARKATIEAIQTEQAGNALAGIRIRAAVMRYGALLRVQSTTAIGTLVGTAIETISITRPGAIANPANAISETGAPEATILKEVEDARRKAYCGFLDSHGQSAEAKWARSELLAADAQQDIHFGWDGEDSPLRSLVEIWIAGLILCACAVLAILGAGLTRIWAVRRAAPEDAEASLPAIRGAAAALLLATILFGGACFVPPLTLSEPWAPWTLAPAIVTAVALIWGVFGIRPRRQGLVPLSVSSFAIALVTLAITAGAVLYSVSPARAYISTGLPLLYGMYGGDWSQRYINSASQIPGLVIDGIVLAAAVAAMLLRRRNCSRFAQRLALASSYTAAGIVLASCICVAVTSAYEARASAEPHGELHNELQYVAALQGKTLPPYIPPPPMPR